LAPPDPAVYKVLDVNYNRAREGLRVCEDILRFCLKDAAMTGRFRRIRHAVTKTMACSSVSRKTMILERKIAEDPGKNFPNKTPKHSFRHLYFANLQRTKEALRVLEEFLKLKDTKASLAIQKIRFDVYEAEKKSVEKFPSLFDPR